MVQLTAYTLVFMLAMAQAATQAQDYIAMISAEMSMAALDATPQPTPTPSPVTSNCKNCNGRGKIGDGTTMVTCPVCDGTGKSVTKSLADLIVDSGRAHCSYPGNIKQHLVSTHGYSLDDLTDLTVGQMETLHDSAHEGRGRAADLPVLRRQPVRKGLKLFGRCGLRGCG